MPPALLLTPHPSRHRQNITEKHPGNPSKVQMGPLYPPIQNLRIVGSKPMMEEPPDLLDAIVPVMPGGEGFPRAGEATYARKHACREKEGRVEKK